MAFKFPFSNLHELTLDWVLEQVKRFAELIPEMETSSEDIQQAITKADNAQATADEAIELIGQVSGATPSDATPLVDGTATPGTSSKYSRGDHKHPTDTSRASAADLDTLQDQVNNITVPVASSDFPEMDGTAAAGISSNYSRKDHVHPTDTSRASAADLTALSIRVDNISGGATPSTTEPAMDGVASAGISANYSRGDHVHPTDTSRASAADLTALSVRVDNISGGATPSSTEPAMDGVASAGSSANYSRGDHVHPTDTSRASAANLTALQNQVNNLVIPSASSANPAMDGTAAPGSASTYSRSDHVHPSDTSKASAADLTTLQNQVNNLVIPSASSANPVMDGTATPGSASSYSRSDHVHPTDTSRASANNLSIVQGMVNDLKRMVSDVALADADTLNTGIPQVCLIDVDTLHSPARAGVTLSEEGVLIGYAANSIYAAEVAIMAGSNDVFIRYKSTTWTTWQPLSGSSFTVSKITVQLSTSWTAAGTNIYTQNISLANVTANTQVDLNPGAAAILQMVSDGTYAIYVENNNGTLTAYAVGSAPTAALTISGVRYETV